ncbi:MAG TPA: DNA gyrase inhibitor YacG [Usitatibacter sp.]|nr:DNA gyrase inhibitor YacG [Usitatibacter sp.]
MSEAKPARIIACPVCGKATAFAASNRWRPFCSERCRMNDLGAWASESYRIPAAPGEDDSAPPDESRDQIK